ncbi:hypothetical protein M378DRAFT_26384 [Amanita muscaria Koide BX008]|uniref:Uncharacterized protein n=1 Tax=Amanita muscaria (strain Koide BX008) TaxID=946122 RepID=A0A0C2WVG6_AMAMK|nr:hypothetical protein M378DRAFT_26384 [Amanita muscaria Koide BX008]
MMYFGAIAGMHLATEEADEYPHRNDLCAIANERSMKILDDQLDQDPEDELEDDDEIDKTRQEIAELIDQHISCRDKRSGKIIKYVVVDYINSLIAGDYVVLEDRQGRRRNVTLEQLLEIRVHC